MWRRPYRSIEIDLRALCCMRILGPTEQGGVRISVSFWKLSTSKELQDGLLAVGGFRKSHTCSLAPGSFTATIWSSLYLSKACFSFAIKAGSSSEVRVLMSLTTSCSSPGGALSIKDDAMSTVEPIFARCTRRAYVQSAKGWSRSWLLTRLEG